MQNFLFIVLFLASQSSWSEQRIELQSTIVGNKELPTVTYLLPWKSAKPSELSEVDFRSVLDQELLPLERELFRRELMFYDFGSQN